MDTRNFDIILDSGYTNDDSLIELHMLDWYTNIKDMRGRKIEYEGIRYAVVSGKGSFNNYRFYDDIESAQDTFDMECVKNMEVN